jgi:hypothetical protein
MEIQSPTLILPYTDGSHRLGKSAQTWFMGKMGKNEDPASINWQLAYSGGDAERQKRPFIAIPLKLHRQTSEATYFHSGGVSTTHKIRPKFLPNTFEMAMRILPQGHWERLAKEDIVSKGEKLPQNVVQLRIKLHEGKSLCLEGYPWPFEGPPPVMDAIQSKAALVCPLFLRDLVKRRIFEIVMPDHGPNIADLRAMGNVFFEKGHIIPYQHFRTPVPGDPFATDLTWNLQRFRQVIPLCQAEIPQPYSVVFTFDQFEDWGISASQAVVQDIFDLLLEAEEIRAVEHRSIFVRVYPEANTKEKRGSEYWVLLKHSLVSAFHVFLLFSMSRPPSCLPSPVS